MITICRTSVLLGLVVTVAIAQGQSCSKPVAGPNMKLRNKFILSETFPNNSRVSFACADGYMAAGWPRFITCTSGTWSPVKLICQRSNCGYAGEVEYGRVDYPEGSEFGDRLVASCNTGYNRIGRTTIYCGARGWMGRLPVCEAQACDPPPPLTNGDYSPKVEEVYFYENMIIYSCDKGFALDGSKSAVCSESGQFMPRDPPDCIYVGDVKCKDPGRLANGERTAGFQAPHGYLSTVTFRCDSGYIMVGAGTIRCGLDSNWSPGLPQCRFQRHADCG
ncbi:membrane cofactor protein-like [Solea solea]|uniref:membrane cofactor protein-like n=1 Tax=Solea solea TaxID=90069 RepID=UPI00272CECE5|nr:membrane cofactor protein-like [Solea solea]